MYLRRKQKLVTAGLAGGTLLLIAGGALAATLPSGAHQHQADSQPVAAANAAKAAAPQRVEAVPRSASSPSATAPSTGSPLTRTSRSRPQQVVVANADGNRRMHPSSAHRKSITYVVKEGDTLSGIAAWFKLHGFTDLYQRNAKVIGANPNVIRPGERITITRSGVVTMRNSS